MPDINKNFMIPLKVTWIRRMVTKSNKYLNIVSELFPLATCKSNVGSDFVKLQLNKVTKLFWFQAFEGYIKLTEKKSK